MVMDTRRRIQFSAPGAVEVVTETAPSPGPNEVRVRTEYSAISPGTERLVYEGSVPDGLAADVSIDALEGEDLSYPISYGYACVGTVVGRGEKVPDGWMGASVFSFQPHVSQFVAAPDALVQLPDAAASTDAVMIPSLETAVNLVMDGRPMIGETAVLFGQGVVGLLTGCLLADYPLDTLVGVEPMEDRRAQAEDLGVSTVPSVSALPAGLKGEEGGGASEAARADLVYELTGRPEVLNEAVRCTGFGGRLVVGSWYGTKRAPIDLGGHFHRSRMRVLSSQVSTIDPSLQGRWSKERRMSVVLDLLSEVQPGRLISDRFSVSEASSVYERLAGDASMLQPIFVYE